MKPSSRAVWLVLASVLAGLFLLVDPLGWFAEESEAVSVDHPAFEMPPRQDAPALELAGGVDAPPAKHVATDEREAIEPLHEAGIAAFRVLDWTGQSVSDAQVLIVRGDELLLDQRTNEAGVAEVHADGEPAGLVIALVARPLEWFDVVLTAGLHELSLTEGARLHGRFVTEDGGTPGKLHVSLNSDYPTTVIPHLPAVVDGVLRAWTLRGAYGTFDTNEEGTFDLTGLPPDWSGRLWMRGGWKVLSTTHGEIGASAGGVRFTEPATDVVVRLARHRNLHGRLVLRDDGAPLDGARLVAVLRSPHERFPTHTSARTDQEGHFSFESKQDVINEFDLRLGVRIRESVSLLRLDEESLPADGDLGDVVVDDVRHVPFLLQDAQGAPIDRGMAVAAGVRSERTGEDGRGELRWIARVVDSLVAEAQGFVPTAHDIPPAVVDPLVVTMERANQLDVKLILEEGSDAAQFKVVLRGEGTITAGPVRDARDQLRHIALGRWAYPLVELSNVSADTFLCGEPDPRTNTATFFALLPGVSIELEIHGITGDMVYHSETLAPFAPEEHREIEVPLASGMITFRGHVRDEKGRPLQLASVQLGGQILGFTDDEGAFECFLAGPETGTLLVGHIACTTLYLFDYAVPTDGRPVEFRLKPARPLTIEVVDENGTPMPEAEVYTLHGGFSTTTSRIEGHRHRVAAMPDVPFEIRVDLAGREYEQAHDPWVSEARVVVPVHGRVVGLVDAKTTAGRAGRFTLHLMPPEGEDARGVLQIRDSVPGLRIEIPVVHPGTYRAILGYEPSAAEKEAGREREDSERVTIIVEAGEETAVRLALPTDDG